MEGLDSELTVDLQHVATDCEGPIKRPGARARIKLPSFLGTRVGVVISYVGAKAVRVNCPFKDGDFCTNKAAGDRGKKYSCHRVDNVLEGGYKLSDKDVGAEVYPITEMNPAYRIVKIEDDGRKLILQRADDPEIEVSMVRSGEYENVYVSEEFLSDDNMLVLQVVRLSDGRIDFIVFKDVEPY